MNFKSLKIKAKLLVLFTTAILVVMIGGGLIMSHLTKRALDNNLRISLQVLTRIAANAVVAGLEFEDEEAVAMAVEGFTNQEIFSYLCIRNKAGESVFHYRKKGFAEIKDNQELVNSEKEIFNELSVMSNSDLLVRSQLVSRWMTGTRPLVPREWQLSLPLRLLS